MRSDADMIEAVLAGDREAFGELVRRYEGVVHAVAMGVLRDHHAAQDACQESFIAAYRSLAVLRQRDSFGAWIVKLARNEALTLVRRKWPEQPLGDLSDELPAHQGNGRMDERSRRLLEAVTRLPEDQQAVVMLKYFAGHSIEEISQMTGQPAGTVGSQLHRARERLRERLEEVQP